ncbi:MAG: class I SAM-dependent rRNA methyltransferase [Chromatiales bacterium]|jgi:23S rRNA (cytosine1962-C5)-methyltransferase
MKTPDLPPLRLKKDQDRRLRTGHCWVYSNEVDVSATPLKELEPGQGVNVLAHNGKWLGSGYVNPNVLLCARLVSRDPAHPMDQSLLVHRLKIALGLRSRLYGSPFYRLVFGESDGLPGLVVDRYGDLAVVQITTAGMERMKQEIVAAVDKVLRPAGILLRNDAPLRRLEGLELYVEDAAGEVASTVELDEGGVRFRVDPRHGQKTGWFFDQADNRARLLRYVEGARVLDLCSYVGGWGIRAVAGGAAGALCVDTSEAALEGVARNAALNGVADRVDTLRGDAFDVLKGLREERRRFDLVVLDPPAFVKRRKDLKEGTLAYRRLNQLACQLLEKDALLVSCSCSFHMGGDALLQAVNQAGRHTDRSLQLLEAGRQGPDHPIHPAIPETGYLKALFLRVLPSF